MPEQKRELRFIKNAEVRIAGDDKPIIDGYAALYDEPTEIGKYYTEIIKPGAFTRALKEKQDVRALIDHNPEKILGRTKSKTLRLAEDAKGLHYEIDPPNTSIANDLMESIKRGDIDQSSFAFIVRSQTWREDGDKLVREINDVDLFDVSPVTYPACEGTSVSVRTALTDEELGIPAELLAKRAKREEASAEPAADDFKERSEMKLRLEENL